MAEDLLTRIRRELDERMSELRPQIAEIDALEAARDALQSVDGAGRAARAKPKRATGTRTRAARARERAPRGANRRAILELVEQRPDVSEAELAAKTGIAKPTLKTTLRTLIRQGVIEKREVGGVAGYHLR